MPYSKKRISGAPYRLQLTKEDKLRIADTCWFMLEPNAIFVIDDDWNRSIPMGKIPVKREDGTGHSFLVETERMFRVQKRPLANS
jgi:hypothetical protein